MKTIYLVIDRQKNVAVLAFEDRLDAVNATYIRNSNFAKDDRFVLEECDLVHSLHSNPDTPDKK